MKGSSSCRNNGKKRLAAAGAFLFWVAVWQAVHMVVGRDFLLASPLQTLERMLRFFGERVFWRSVWASALRVLWGFGLGITLGAALALVCAKFSGVKTLFAPMLSVIRATPVVSFILLALIWMTTSRLPVFIAFLMVLPLAYANMLAGLETLDAQLLEMARLFRLGHARVLRLIYLPALLPHIISACATGIGFAWKAVVAAEVISHPALSMGRQIHRARIYFQVGDLFAWTLTVIIMSVALEKAVVLALRGLEHRLLAPQRDGRQKGGGENA